jgi:hypothetical protein
MNITFIGNCQTVSLCFYFQQLLKQTNCNVCWVLYGEEFKIHLTAWSIKCKNKILDHEDSIQCLKNSDIIIYQSINITKSLFSNATTLQEIKKSSCKLIQISSFYFSYNNFENSMQELINREKNNNVDIPVSTIFYKFKDDTLLLGNTTNHPNTFLFMEIVKLLCSALSLDFFTEEQYNTFLTNENYMDLNY